MRKNIRSKLGLDSPRSGPIGFSQLLSSEFNVGAILQIKLKNFMTYEKMVIEPGPGLNLIVGPNGSGKSSIITAIGLGLGGTPMTVLGTKVGVKSFVRHTCKKAVIKILLRGEVSNIWIRRIISKDDTTEWHLKLGFGGWIQKTYSEIRDTLEGLHIKIDNFCMFLPQQKVKEFATLKPGQLLEHTLLAINNDLEQVRKSLVADFRRIEEDKKQKSDIEKEIEQQQKFVQVKEEDVRKYRMIETTREELRICEIKFRLLRGADIRSRYKDKKHEFQDARKKLEELAMHRDSYLSEIRHHREPLERARKERLKNKDDFLRDYGDAKDTKEEMARASLKLSKMNGKRETCIARMKELDEKHRKVSAVIDALKGSIPGGDEYRDVDSFRHRSQELKSLLKDRKVEQRNIESRCASCDERISNLDEEKVDLQKRIQAARNTRRRVLNTFRSWNKFDVLELDQFIQQNNHMFSGRVYGPIAAELRFRSATAAAQAESLIDARTKAAFLTETLHDYEIISKFLRERNMHQITLYKPSTEGRVRPDHPDLSRFGFCNWVVDLIEAPEPVIQLLMGICLLHRIPLRENELDPPGVDTERMRHEMLSLGVSSYIAGRKKLVLKKSRFCSDVTILTSVIREARLFANTGDVNAEQLEAKVLEIEQQKEEIGREKAELEERHMALASEIDEVNTRLGDMNRYMKDFQSRISRLRDAEENLASIESEQQSSRRFLVDFDQKKAQQYTELVGILERWKDSVGLLIKHGNICDKCDYEIREIQRRNAGVEQALEEMEAAIAEQKQTALTIQAELQEIKRELDESDGFQRSQHSYDDETRAKLAALSDDIEQIESHYNSLKQRMAMLSMISPTVIASYERAKHIIEEKTRVLYEIEERINKTAEKFERKRREWVDNVNMIINEINSAFENLMKLCGYRGSVMLICDSEGDLSTYKLQLSVAFTRDGELKTLSGSRQSGGEKSVTTLLYLLALHQIEQFPFRVIDEINQGMDEVNEKNTFEQIMSSVLQEDAQDDTERFSQYFLVSPKLLPNLEFKHGITVMVVCNGPSIDHNIRAPITLDDKHYVM